MLCCFWPDIVARRGQCEWKLCHDAATNCNFPGRLSLIAFHKGCRTDL
jgi:hypothetical protein